MFGKIKKIVKLENLLCFFIVICPVLDILSFLFRNKFNTNYSISTFVRPIIPGIVFIFLFFKKNIKVKLRIIGMSLLYIAYGLMHLYIYNNMHNGCSYGTVIHEAQYIVNYSFMILNLYIFRNVFEKENSQKLKISLLISLVIYIISIYIALITNTSSTTYIEGIGYKGWFESGNSISAILILGSFILMSFIMKINNKVAKGIVFSTLMLIGIYLMIFIGTRAGLIGFVISILSFIIAQIFEKTVIKVKIKKETFFILFSILVLLLVVVIIAGSVTIKRRQHLKNMESTIIDEATGEISNVTGDLSNYRAKIINNQINEDFMTKEQQQSIVDLYNIAKKYNISNTNTRAQQLIYHVMLIKNQKNIGLMLIGNGYLINTNELVWEMEFPAILCNFGVIGFSLYMMPFVLILIKSLYYMLKNIKMIDTEYIMLVLALSLSFALSTLSGYTFFNSSSMMVVIIANTLLMNKIKIIKVGNN